MEPRVPAGITKPDKKTKDGCRRRPGGNKGKQYAAVAVATALHGVQSLRYRDTQR